MGAMNNNNTTGGGIAGVASKSTGKTIKIVNDQTDRSLWEFVYDMQKDAMANASAAGGNSGIGGNNNSTNSSGTNSSGSNSTSFPGSTATGVPGQSSSFSPNGGSSPGSAFSIPPPQPVPQPQNQ